jgi:hypothetical protein
MESAERQDSTVVRFGLGVASLVLAFAALGAWISALVLLAMAPEVGVRPGVQSYSEFPDSDPITNCGGASLRVAVLGPRVRADTVQHAQQAARACAWSAKKNIAIAKILLFLITPPILYVMLRIKLRMDGENAEFNLDF